MELYFCQKICISPSSPWRVFSSEKIRKITRLIYMVGENTTFFPFFFSTFLQPPFDYVRVMSASVVLATGCGLSLSESDVSEMCCCFDLLVSIFYVCLANSVAICTCGFVSSTSDSLFIWLVSLGTTYYSSSSSSCSKGGGGHFPPLFLFSSFLLSAVVFVGYWTRALWMFYFSTYSASECSVFII